MAHVTESTAPVYRIRTSRDLARLAARLADEKKGGEIVAIDISQIEGAPAEWFVVVTCTSDQHIRAVADHIERETKRCGLEPPRTEGWEGQQWVILDYFDVVIHLMRPDARKFYKLENLWADGQAYHLSSDGRLIRLRTTS
ncbi:MAG: ribosome silencing factor [Bacteroidota bacterium]|nr:ribosome silencing factor [Candidatus Kapabacteria bacterium]MCS7301951.1 ribosome silencing factor [Candidatus Kapabacteria bacterium]MCX7936593.1 ribosome silencing factor [Chlorobiota bacterium]MDW8074786.1 ribosome silencing factor [Bacteroidota bacterium]MDW8271425.1 ribosome silencing factor [Bacteroidota bacterium]